MAEEACLVVTRAPFLAALTSPYVLLTISVLCWGGNFVVGRVANTDMPPMALSFWRHALASAMIVPFVWSGIRADWPVMRRNLPMLAVLSGILVAANTLVYFAVLHTTVVNAALINGGVPVSAVFFSWLVSRDLINRWQAVGILFCFTGIATVVTKADMGVLLALDFGWGDLYMLCAVILWGIYMVLLKRSAIRVSGWPLVAVLTVGGMLWLIPGYGIEHAMGLRTEWTWLTLGSLVYVALFTTIIAWACWNNGTMQIGPNRASAFMCLHPLFGPLFGWAFFGELLYPYHAVGTVLVLSGVILVSRRYTARQAAHA